MNIETRNLGVTNGDRLEQQAQRALGSALDRFEDRVRRVRVRFISGGRPDAICRVRVWCGRGPTVVIEEHAANGTAAVDAAAETGPRAATPVEWPSSPPTSRSAGGQKRRAGDVVNSATSGSAVSTILVGSGVLWPVAVVQSPSVTETRRRRLARASEQLRVHADPVICGEASAADAILGEARARRADIVVVGTRRRARLDGLFGPGVAAQVVNRARRSVLVTPFDSSQTGEAQPPLGV